jgi:hypothetical protein
MNSPNLIKLEAEFLIDNNWDKLNNFLRNIYLSNKNNENLYI